MQPFRLTPVFQRVEKKWFRPASPVAPLAIGSVFLVGGLGVLGNMIYQEVIGGQIRMRYGGSRRLGGGTVIEDPQFLHYLPFILMVLAFIALGVFCILYAFVGYETTSDGITSVDPFRRRKTVRWAEVSDISRIEHYLILKSPTSQVKVYTGADWSKLRAELHAHMPDKIALLE